MVRTYNIRGAHNKMASISAEDIAKGVVCASAGNHPQGVTYACRKKGIKGNIFIPTTPAQKIKQVKIFRKEWVEVILINDMYNYSFNAAQIYVKELCGLFVHPFDDLQVMEGQGKKKNSQPSSSVLNNILCSLPTSTTSPTCLSF